MTHYHSFTFFAVEEHTYLLWDDTGEACAVDAGMYYDSEKKLFDDFLSEHNLRLVRSIHTHLHFDHYMGAHWIKETYGVEAEAPLIDIEDKIPLCGPFVKAHSEIFRIVMQSEFRPLPEAGKSVMFGNTFLRILSVPGHTPGHVAFYEPASGFVLCGDVLFKGDIGRTDLWRGDYRRLLESIHRELFTLPDDTVVLPGHGPETDIGTEKAGFRYS